MGYVGDLGALSYHRAVLARFPPKAHPFDMLPATMLPETSSGQAGQGHAWIKESGLIEAATCIQCGECDAVIRPHPQFVKWNVEGRVNCCTSPKAWDWLVSIRKPKNPLPLDGGGLGWG